MPLRLPLLLLTALLCATPCLADDYDTVRERWLAMQTGGPRLNLADPVLAGKARTIGQTADSHWKSMEKSKDRANLWADRPIGNKSVNLFEHFKRLETMSLAYATRGSGREGDRKLAADIIDALDWLHARYLQPDNKRFGNWWEWEIGIPLALLNTTTALYPDLGPARVEAFMASIDTLQPTVHMSGANRLWECEVIILRGVLGKNSDRIAAGIQGLDQVLRYNTKGWGDGFYDDGSFIQHGRIPYNGGYGKSLFRDIVDLMYLLSGSPWEIDNPAAKNVFAWARDSYEPFIYKAEMMDLVRGREIAQPSRDSRKIGHQTIHPFVRLAQFAPPEHAARCKSLVKYWLQTGGAARDFAQDVPADIAALARAILQDPAVTPAPEPVMHRRFPMMARVVHIRPGFAFALAMSSAKVGRYEAINSTNGRGWHTSDGMTYLYNGDLAQFGDHFWPTVDSRRLPGTTVDTIARKNAEGNNSLSPHDWVGGTDLDGESGITGMQLQGFGVSLTAKKSWFMFADRIVALGADIRSTDGRPIETIVENRKIRDDAANDLTVNGSPKPKTKGWSEPLRTVSWIHLEGNVPGSGIGYHFPAPADVQALREARTDKWSNICSAGGDRDDTLRTKNYLTLWFDHGPNPAGATYAYVLLPNKTPQQVRAYAASPRVQILENTPEAQAVRDLDLRIIGINFWNDAPKTVAGITSNQKASVMLRENAAGFDLAVSDPTQANKGVIELELDRSAAALVSAPPGVKVLALSPRLRLSISVKGTQGKTHRATFATAEKATTP